MKYKFNAYFLLMDGNCVYFCNVFLWREIACKAHLQNEFARKEDLWGVERCNYYAALALKHDARIWTIHCFWHVCFLRLNMLSKLVYSEPNNKWLVPAFFWRKKWHYLHKDIIGYFNKKMVKSMVAKYQYLWWIH